MPRARRSAAGPGRTARRGFTLIEVLAAVAVLGIVYTVLARLAMQGLAAEGDASRRLEASLIADRALSDLEALVAAGGAPPAGVTETESGDYATETEVRPFDLAALLPAEVPRYLQRAGGAHGQRSLELLRAPARGAAPLLELRVRVHWVEGAFEQQVSRTSFATDPAALAPHLEELHLGGEDAGTGNASETPEGEGQEP